MKRESKELIESARGIRDLRQRAFEFKANSGNYNLEINEVLQRAEEILNQTLVRDSVSINKKLNLFKGTLNKVVDPNSSVEIYLKEKLSNCLKRILVQESRVIESGSGVTGKIGTIYQDDTLRKIVNGLIFDFYRALKTSKEYNLSSSYTNKLLDKLHVVSPIAVGTLLYKFRNSPLLKSAIEGLAINFADAEERIIRMEREFVMLTKLYSNNPDVSKMIINRYILDLSPKDSIEKYLKNLKEALAEFSDISPRIIKKEVSSNPKNYKEKLRLYRENFKSIEESGIYVHAVGKEFFALRAKSKENLLNLILEYQKKCEILENEEEFKAYKYLIRRVAHDKEEDEIREYLRKFITTISKLVSNPENLPEEYRSNTTNIERVILAYGADRIIEKLNDISKKYRNLTKYFLENDNTFNQIYNLYGVNLIEIFYVSPVKSEEENKQYFLERITIYGKLLSRITEKYSPYQESRGYISLLKRAIYRENPEEYLRIHGYEI